MTDARWFDVDKKGLAEIVERRGGKAWLVQELISNAWDEPGVTTCEVVFMPHEGKPLVDIIVRDDSPDGFADLRHAWTLFAPSCKRGNAEVRGRFNLGEKLVLALCTEASIETTTGGVMFDARGRRPMRSKRPRGSEFIGTVRMTRADLDDVRKGLRRLLPPSNIITTIDGERLPERPPIKTFTAHLWTEIAEGDEGALVRRYRSCEVRLLRPLAGETAQLYELGIPVVETADSFHVDVRQKVPLNIERDNVTPAYLRDLRSEVLNHAVGLLDTEQKQAAWVTDALGHYATQPDAIGAVVDARYGAKRVAYDPSDIEANSRAVAEGYTVVHGGSLPAEAWERVRQSNLIPAAGRVTPTPNPDTPGAPMINVVDQDTLSADVRRGLAMYHAAARACLGRPISIRVAHELHWPYEAVWCRGKFDLVLNLGKLREEHFTDREAIFALALHEFAHEAEGNHLAEAFHEEICRLGARLAVAASRGDLEWCKFTSIT